MVVVKVNEGSLEGELLNSDYGTPYYSFKGVPFAQPPVGDLRFKAPLPPKPWEGVRSAKKFGSECIQYEMFNPVPTIVGSEDCLYLNVYTPEIKPKKPYPVMFWIHGGGYSVGSGDDALFGPEFLIKHDVVVVTINYRLEVLGFLCLDTEDIPGNAGMKDQVQALRWVNKNIANFGGDPKNITIFGESAGGGSVSHHLTSPMTKGLFRRAIAQSGASLSWWAQSYRPRDRALALARQLGCYSNDNKELYEFFKRQPAEKLIAISVPNTISEPEHPGFKFPFTIVDEKQFGNKERFFYGNPVEVVSRGIHKGVDVMTGYTTDEGYVNIDTVKSLEDRLKKARDFPEVFVPEQFQYDLTPNQQLELGKELRKYYLNKEVKIPDDWESLVKFYGMNMFIFPTDRWVKICARAKKNNIYLYLFSYKSERCALAQLMGLSDLVKDKQITNHADDVFHLFNAKVLQTRLNQPPLDRESETFKLVDRLTKLWTNFAKYGNPTPDNSLGVKWSPYTLEKQEYLNIGNELSNGTAPYAEEIQHWEKTLKRYVPSYFKTNKKNSECKLV